MIGVNITTKDGILLFSHFFVPGFSDVDEDLRAGLMTAILNAMKETHEDTGINTIDQGKYFVHIVEGEFTYGLFFSQENDINELKFANRTVDQFESEFNQILVKQISFQEIDFLKFHNYLKKEYSSLISIDVVGLSKMIDIMNLSNISNFIILEKTNLHQVFTTMSTLPEIHPYANQIGLMCKNFIESGAKIEHEITQLKFNLGRKFVTFLEVYGRFVLIIVVIKKDVEKTLKELHKVNIKINSNFL